MVDTINMMNNTVEPLKHGGQTRQQALSRYEASKDVDRQAKITKPMDEPVFRRAVDKLNERMSVNKPLRDDVPRGFYLNVRV